MTKNADVAASMERIRDIPVNFPSLEPRKLGEETADFLKKRGDAERETFIGELNGTVFGTYIAVFINLIEAEVSSAEYHFKERCGKRMVLDFCATIKGAAKLGKLSAKDRGPFSTAMQGASLEFAMLVSPILAKFIEYVDVHDAFTEFCGWALDGKPEAQDVLKRALESGDERCYSKYIESLSMVLFGKSFEIGAKRTDESDAASKWVLEFADAFSESLTPWIFEKRGLSEKEFDEFLNSKGTSDKNKHDK